jgi:serine/threonine-protein kinase
MSPELPAPTDRALVIGHYKVIKRLGAGGMGAVYQAVDTHLGREVALKVLPPDLAGKPEMLERFRQEAQTAASLRHEHIVTLYEFGTANGTHFLAMEYVEGINLHEYIQAKGRLEAELARKLIFQAAKALALAHEHGIVHRDIKPSNFLLTRKDGRLFVKLTDFGLARSIEDTDFKVTRTGQTVGTVDYISPEQARNSRAADIRSDIYSLGCTLYHMLAGQPPFPEGDLTERLLKHVEAEPEDVRHFNPDVPPGLVVVLSQMLAKKPEQRYQTPAELLKDLEHLPSGFVFNPREWMEALAQEVGTKPKRARRPAPDTKKTGTVGPTPVSGEIPKLQYRNSQLPIKRKKNPEESRPFQPLLVISGWKAWSALGIATVATLFLVLALSLRWGARRPGSNLQTLGGPAEQSEQAANPALKGSQESADQSDEQKMPARLRKELEAFDATAPQPGPPRIPVADELVQDARRTFQLAVTPAALESSNRFPQGYDGYFRTGQLAQPSIRPPSVNSSAEQTEAPGNSPTRQAAPNQPGKPANDSLSAGQPAASPSVPVYVVSRMPGSSGGRHAESLASACAQAAKDNSETIIVEIRDNGPLFETPVALTGRNLVLRAAKGFRPLLCWDLGAKAGTKSTHFISVNQGGLALENLDVVLKASDEGPAEAASLLHVQGGHLVVDRCTFSVTGRSTAGVAVIRLEGTRADGSACVARLDHSYCRGAEMKLLDLKAPGADVALDSCLAAGAYRPLLDIQIPSAAKPINLRVARSTLVSGQTLMRVRAASRADHQGVVSWMGWDTLLARYGNPMNGEMVDLQEGLEPTTLKWRAVNCLYTGWPTLLKWGTGAIAADDLGGWQKLWNQVQGEAVREPTWPALLPADTCEVPPSAFRVVGTHTEFAATIGKGTLGCDVTSLPLGRERWLAFTYDRLVPPPFYSSPTDQPPEIPAAADNAYSGEGFNAIDRDLGEYLNQLQANGRLGRKVVLRLAGKGEARTSPIHLKDVNLVFFFEPASSEKDRLVLVPTNAADHRALIDIERGSLDIIGGKIRFPKGADLTMPDYVLRVEGGDLHLSGCRLEGALDPAKKSYQGLIDFHGSGDSRPERAYECTLANSILLSGQACLFTRGTGARTRVQNCLLLAGTDAFHVDIGRAYGSLNSSYILEHNSVAARRAVFRLSDISGLTVPFAPLVVQARANAFVNPFAEADLHPGILLCENEALPHGLMAWQGEANAFDSRLHYYASGERAPETKQPFSSWEHLWGSAGERQPSQFNGQETKTLDLTRPQLNRLALPPTFVPRESGTLPGANFQLLGIGVKKG